MTPLVLGAADIARLLAQRIGELAKELLPAGHRDGHEWRCGSTYGEAGASLGVHLTGAKAGVWSDFASDESGDALDLVRAVLRCEMPEALRWARRWLGIEDGKAAVPPRSTPTSAPKKSAERYDAKYWRRAWQQASPIAGTLAAVYLNARGLHFNDPDGRVLRFRPRHGRKNTKGELEYHPALLAALHDVKTSELCGIHNIYLEADGHDRLRDKKAKTTWGRGTESAVMLDPFDAPVQGLVLAEGVETAISLLMAELHPVWATAGAGKISTFPILGGIEAITIAADRGKPGQDAAAACVARWQAAGRQALILTPPEADDWAEDRRAA